MTVAEERSALWPVSVSIADWHQGDRIWLRALKEQVPPASPIAFADAGNGEMKGSAPFCCAGAANVRDATGCGSGLASQG